MNSELQQTYDKLKAQLVQEGCKITAYKQPEYITTSQGSLWGMSPRTAKKNVTWQLSPADSATRITVSSKLASDWKNLTILGSALSVVVAAVCLWIAADLEGFLVTSQSSWWSWIATSNGVANAAVASSFVTLTRVLAVFLAVVVALEVIIYVYARQSVDGFAEEALRQMA